VCARECETEREREREREIARGAVLHTRERGLCAG